MHTSLKGLVLRETVVGESDKILSVLFFGSGRHSVSAKGAKRHKNKLFSVAQPFVYADFAVFLKNGRYILDGGEQLAGFYGLRRDLQKLSLANYIGEICILMTDEDIEEDGLLRLALNSLYALSDREYDPDFIKSVFELRAAAECGYLPELNACVGCGSLEESFFFCSEQGGVICPSCVKKAAGGSIKKISRSQLEAMRYIVGCDPSRIFSFTMDDVCARGVYSITENFLLAKIMGEPKTLNFYKGLKGRE